MRRRGRTQPGRGPGRQTASSRPPRAAMQNARRFRSTTARSPRR
jgi:hypothetical protein